MSNSAWDGRKVNLFGARNEIIAFQLVVEADENGISGLNVSLARLMGQGGKAGIEYSAPALDPTEL